MLLFANSTAFSLYIHVPFCEVKCNYCDFYSVKQQSAVDSYLRALDSEVKRQLRASPHLKDLPVRTIFVGGGTPSILSVTEWQRLAAIIGQFTLDAVEEWSVECNPESFSVEKAEAYLTSGVNRLSFGVQSLNEEELRQIGRIHRSDRVREVLAMPILEQFDAISADLIYGLPSQTAASFKETLDELSSMPILKHISAYELTLAEGTPFYKERDSLAFPDEDVLLEIIAYCRERLSAKGFDRYEISNYAQKGFESLHNCAYWKREPYLGLGPSAHSFDGAYRFANPASLAQWKTVQEQSEHIEYDAISEEGHIEEFLFLMLRMVDGFSDRQFVEMFGLPFEQGRAKATARFIDEGILVHEAGRWFLSERGLDLVDAVVVDLLEDPL